MDKRQFGVSTLLYHPHRLCRDDLLEIAAHGFEAVEVVASPTHFDYNNAAAIADLQRWLAEAGLELARIHAPVGASNAAEAEQALSIARRIPVNIFVVHLEGPRDAARRAVERLAALAAPLGVKIALEVALNDLSRPDALVSFIEDELDHSDEAGSGTGICLDFGHAHIGGDLIDAIESVSEHLLAVDLHDNGGRNDDHLVPFDGTIDWPSALTTVQKVGYEGAFMFEVGARGSTTETLGRARKARERLEKLLCTSI